MPPNREDLVVMRILVRHGVSMDLGQMLVNDMAACLEYFKKNVVSTPLESAGYCH
jgi:glutamate decarboxylase